MGFYLDEASCLRMLDHANIDELIARRKQWREIAQQRWVNNRQKHGIILGRSYKEITDKTVQDLHSVAQLLINSKQDYKLVVSVHQGYIYTNDLGLIDQLADMHELSYLSYSQAVISRPRDTVLLKNSKYKLRSFLRTVSLSRQEKDCLDDFFGTQQKFVRLSPALQRWVDQPFARLQDYFFVDHDSETWLTMLNLVRPGLVRKTMHIIPAK
jgi:hypothetical protein